MLCVLVGNMCCCAQFSCVKHAPGAESRIKHIAGNRTANGSNKATMDPILERRLGINDTHRSTATCTITRPSGLHSSSKTPMRALTFRCPKNEAQNLPAAVARRLRRDACIFQQKKAPAQLTHLLARDSQSQHHEVLAKVGMSRPVTGKNEKKRKRREKKQEQEEK